MAFAPAVASTTGTLPSSSPRFLHIMPAQHSSPLLQQLSLTTKVGLLIPLWGISQDISLILGFTANPLEVCSLPVSQPDYELQKGRKLVNPVTSRIPVLNPEPNIW